MIDTLIAVCNRLRNTCEWQTPRMQSFVIAFKKKRGNYTNQVSKLCCKLCLLNERMDFSNLSWIYSRVSTCSTFEHNSNHYFLRRPWRRWQFLFSAIYDPYLSLKEWYFFSLMRWQSVDSLYHMLYCWNSCWTNALN